MSLHLDATGLNISGEGNFKKQSGNLELSVDDIRFRNGDMQSAAGKSAGKGPVER